MTQHKTLLSICTNQQVINQTGITGTVQFHLLTLLANYIVEASVPTIILFCVIRKDADSYTNGRRFGQRPSSEPGFACHAHSRISIYM